MCQRYLLFVTLFVLNSRVPYNLTQKTSDTIRRPIKLLWMPQELLTIFVWRSHKEDKERNLSEEKEETVPFFSMSIAELISCLVGVLKSHCCQHIERTRYLVWALLPKVWYQRSLRNKMARKYVHRDAEINPIKKFQLNK